MAMKMAFSMAVICHYMHCTKQFAQRCYDKFHVWSESAVETNQRYLQPLETRFTSHESLDN